MIKLQNIKNQKESKRLYTYSDKYTETLLYKKNLIYFSVFLFAFEI